MQEIQAVQSILVEDRFTINKLVIAKIVENEIMKASPISIVFIYTSTSTQKVLLSFPVDTHTGGRC